MTFVNYHIKETLPFRISLFPADSPPSLFFFTKPQCIRSELQKSTPSEPQANQGHRMVKDPGSSCAVLSRSVMSNSLQPHGL